jgi:methionyl-tRNA synthetase
VEHFWARLVAAGDIYKGTHSGWYSVSDECFYSVPQVHKGEDGRMIATETGNEVVWEEEVNWKFRLGAFKARLQEWASREGGECVALQWRSGLWGEMEIRQC